MITKISLRVKGLKERKRELTMGKKLVSVEVQRVEGIWYAKEKQQALVLGKYVMTREDGGKTDCISLYRQFTVR